MDKSVVNKNWTIFLNKDIFSHTNVIARDSKLFHTTKINEIYMTQTHLHVQVTNHISYSSEALA
jgi:hypothetical protein